MPALKPILAKIDDVEERYRDLYTERNGKWEFTGVEGLKTQADVDRQLEANRKARDDVAKANTKIKELTDKLALWVNEAGEELSPDDVKTKLEKLATLDAAGNAPELTKNFEKVVQDRVNSIVEGKIKSATLQLTRQVTDLQGKVQGSEQTIQQYAIKDANRTIDDAVRGAAVAAKVVPEAVSDLLLIARGDLKIVEGKVQTEDGRDPAAWLEDRKQKTPYYWPVAQGAGSRGGNEGGGIPQGKDNPFSREGRNVTAIGQILAKDPARAAKLAEAAGVPKNPDGSFQWHVAPAAAGK